MESNVKMSNKLIINILVEKTSELIKCLAVTLVSYW